jgi:hypothetical protein
MVTEAEMKSKQLLKDYSLEEILEAAEVTPEEALEYLITYGIVDPEALELIEATDGTPED